ncbi:NAD(P)/FAD-dependent oxidoreductase [Acidihalobacter ferrooxydans]|uniref:Amine oxidase domain-containing protein n=1 Tax=Acidihalobacter ferrooxydans TaxID=1765967 RepID=A0A1P8UEF8_9GAMM|nr:FAD-dependent oxidoreductase [Acidihalobacter ferrooxydans]APZ42179.1 hypothetical protein BW247_02955 [Acidihalobacter ferrooxydans]
MSGHADAAPRTAVIGAGIAGVLCALDLSLFSDVVLFERDLHPGGRLAVCRGNGFEFDCGAPHCIVTDPDLHARLRDWTAAGYLARWDGWTVELDHGNFMTRDLGATCHVGTPTMAALAGQLAALLDFRAGIEITKLAREGSHWWLVDTLHQRHGPFARVVCAAPPATTARLLEPHAPELATRAADVAMRPRWTVMLGYDTPLPVPFDQAYLEGQDLIWCGRNSSKPGRSAREAWVLQATPEWSTAHATLPAPDVVTTLRQVFATAAGLVLPPPTVAMAHFWPMAEPINPVGEPFLAAPAAGLFACGDWCLAPRVEGAMLSAVALAAALESGAT